METKKLLKISLLEEELLVANPVKAAKLTAKLARLKLNG